MGVNARGLVCPFCKEERYWHDALAFHIAYGHNGLFESQCSCGYRLKYKWSSSSLYDHLRVQDDIVEHLVVAQTMNAIARIGE